MAVRASKGKGKVVRKAGKRKAPFKGVEGEKRYMDKKPMSAADIKEEERRDRKNKSYEGAFSTEPGGRVLNYRNGRVYRNPDPSRQKDLRPSQYIEKIHQKWREDDVRHGREPAAYSDPESLKKFNAKRSKAAKKPLKTKSGTPFSKPSKKER